MVEYIPELDLIFSSLSDPTRRDILKRLRQREMNIGEIAKNYTVSFAAVAKHLNVLERAKLICKNKRGKEQIISITPQALGVAAQYLGSYQELWETRLDSLDTYLQSTKKKGKT